MTGCLVFGGCSVHAQSSDSSSSAPITPKEAAAIEIGRKGAKPRPVMPRKPLDLIESARVEIFKRSKLSAVSVDSSTPSKLPDFKTGTDLMIPPGKGTGFVWDERGHVVTNYHVVLVDRGGDAPVKEAEDLRVTLSNGKSYQARLVGKSLAYDIAVLRVFAPLKDLKPFPLGRSKDLQVGQSVLAIGNPFGLDHTLTQGIISGLEREAGTNGGLLSRSIRGAIQTDAAINPGSSGGPLLDSGGRLIGMNTSVTFERGDRGGESFGFAIPVDTLNRVVPTLIAKGQLERPELGFTAIASTWATQFGVTKGAVVGAVVQNSIADRAGLKGWKIKEGETLPILGDVIVGFQGHPIESEVQLFDLMGLEPPEAVLAFDVMRAGTLVRITMQPK